MPGGRERALQGGVECHALAQYAGYGVTGERPRA